MTDTLAAITDDNTENGTLPQRKDAALSSAVQIDSVDDVVRLGKMMAASGFFSDAQDTAQACVKILAGAELGISPLAAMRGVYVFDGNTTLNSSLIAALIKRHPRYDYEVVKVNDGGAAIDFYQEGERRGRATFSMDDAKQAGLTSKRNWKKYPQDMMFARAMTRGARRFCSEVFLGPVYTPDEMGAVTDKQGNPVQAPDEVEQQAPKRTHEHPDPGPQTEAQELYDEIKDLLDDAEHLLGPEKLERYHRAISETRDEDELREIRSVVHSSIEAEEDRRQEADAQEAEGERVGGEFDLEEHFDPKTLAAGASDAEDIPEDDRITEAQLKRLYAIAKANDWSEGALDRLVKEELGFASKKVIPYGAVYDDVTEALKNDALRAQMSDA